jgi:hypothetical protein
LARRASHTGDGAPPRGGERPASRRCSGFVPSEHPRAWGERFTTPFGAAVRARDTPAHGGNDVTLPTIQIREAGAPPSAGGTTRRCGHDLAPTLEHPPVRAAGGGTGVGATIGGAVGGGSPPCAGDDLLLSHTSGLRQRFTPVRGDRLRCRPQGYPLMRFTPVRGGTTPPVPIGHLCPPGHPPRTGDRRRGSTPVTSRPRNTPIRAGETTPAPLSTLARRSGTPPRAGELPPRR